MTAFVINFTSFIPDNIAGDSHYGNTVIFCSSISCRRYTALIAGSIVGGGISIILLLICISHCYRRCRRRPSQTNTTFVKATNHKSNSYDSSLFKSGIWSSRYLQYGIWHGPTYLSLSFYSHLCEVAGSGSDDLGTFTIAGTYSTKTGRMGLTKVSRSDAGNRTEQLEDQVIIQLVWNSQSRQFEGKRYVRNKTYHEENRMELKFSRPSPPPPVDRV